jgi:hypothetical protein
MYRFFWKILVKAIFFKCENKCKTTNYGNLKFGRTKIFLLEIKRVEKTIEERVEQE